MTMTMMTALVTLKRELKGVSRESAWTRKRGKGRERECGCVCLKERVREREKERLVPLSCEPRPSIFFCCPNLLRKSRKPIFCLFTKNREKEFLSLFFGRRRRRRRQRRRRHRQDREPKKIGTGLKSIFPVSGRFFHRSRNSGMIVKKATFSPVRFRPNRPGRFPGLGSWDKILTKKANPRIKTRRKSVLLYIGKN